MKRVIGFGVATLLFATFAQVTDAKANVALKNGNFFVGFIDAVYPGGYEPKLERIYNSKSVYRGIYGWGWGSEFEVNMTVLPDGSVVVNEFGGGAENRFVPVKQTASDMSAQIQKIIQLARSTGYISRPDLLKQYEQKLKDDRTFLVQEWDRFLKQGKLQSRTIPEGTQLISTRFSYQYITKTREGYVRNSESGKKELFDAAGLLVKVTDRNNNSITLTYAKDRSLQRIVDQMNRKFLFQFDARRRLERVNGEGGKFASYQYNANDELISSRDFDGNSYTFKYSADKRHNLVELGYGDGSKMLITYYPRDKLENVKSVRERDGTSVEYSYIGDRRKPGPFAVTVTNKDKAGKVSSTSQYEYLFKLGKDGEEYTARMMADVEGEKTETLYSEMGLPTEIKKGGQSTRFAYDVKGRVTKKVTPIEVTELNYDDRANKVSKVVRYTPKTPAVKTWYQFQYDAFANLVNAKSSNGKAVQIFYDPSKRIKTLVDQDKRQLNFRYNENSKPTEIAIPQVGSINVTYGNTGDILKVESKPDPKVGRMVFNAIQNLSEIVRPAGVSLSF